MNELHYKEGAALSMELPLNDAQLPAARALRGEQKVAEGIDYRGVRVLGATRRVPDSPWALVAKVDMDEINGPIEELSRLITLLVGLLVTASAAAFGFIWVGQYSEFYRRQYELEAQRLELAQRYEYLTMYANDIFLLTDFDGRIIDANERAIRTYGYSVTIS